jgi:hypothetical protein
MIPQGRPFFGTSWWCQKGLARSLPITSKGKGRRNSDIKGARVNKHLQAQIERIATGALFVVFVMLFALLSNLIASRANAQAAALANDPATLAASADESGNQSPFAYSGQFILETTRTADEAEPISYTGWYQATASATHKKSAINGTARLGYTREYSYQRDDGSNGAFDNPGLSLAKSFRRGKDFESEYLDSVSIALSGAIGANDESRRRTFLWSNGVSITGAKAIGRFNLRQSFGYTHSFFEYDIRDNGVVNSPDSVRSVSMLFYSVNDRVSLGGSFTYGYSISYQGVGRATTMAQVSADYSFTDRISASIGVASERGTLEPDGQSNRIRFFAPEAAQYFADLVISL